MKNILFVCVENSNRSQMAEAFGHLHKTDNLQVYSAGSKPSGTINPKAIVALGEKGIDTNKMFSKSLQEIPNTEYDAVISMGCGEDCPHIPAKIREDWLIPDPKNLSENEYRIIRDYIEIKVKELIQKIDNND